MPALGNGAVLTLSVCTLSVSVTDMRNKRMTWNGMEWNALNVRRAAHNTTMRGKGDCERIICVLLVCDGSNSNSNDLIAQFGRARACAL